MKKSWHAHRKVAPAIERTSRDGILFHSKTELRRWEFLRLLEKAGEVRNLRRQVKYPLSFIINEREDITVKAGSKTAQYTADFVYQEKEKTPDDQWREIIEDVKGYRDEASKFRIRVFEAFYFCSVRIVKLERGVWVSDESLANVKQVKNAHKTRK